MGRALKAEGDTLPDDMNMFFLLLSGYLVFFMQCGFCMLSAGSVRSKNAKNIILKNLLDACFGALGFYFFGYAIAYGGDDKDRTGSYFFLGVGNVALSDTGTDGYAGFFFQYAFAATAATIVSGAVAERTKFEAYLLYAFFLTAWVYPVVVHWVWSGNGWLSAFQDTNHIFNGAGMVDFAGCGVVHMVGGFAGLAGAAIVGPRIGRYNTQGEVQDIPGHSASLALLGVFILWFGWYGFNPGSALAIVGAGEIASLCAVTTTLAAAAGTIATLGMTMGLNFLSTGHAVWDTIAAGNGALGGLVSITSATSVVTPWSAIIIGAIGGFVYVGASKFMATVIKVDDPLDAVAVHGFCGMWGLIAAAAFADKELMTLSYGTLGEDEQQRKYGFLMGGDGALLGNAILGIVVIFCWVMVFMVPFFFVTKLLGLLRVSPEEENAGLDVSHHGGSAYPTDAVKMEGDGNMRKELDALKAEVEMIRRDKS